MTPDAPPVPVSPPVVTRALGALLRVPGQPDLHLPALLRYSAADPYAVRLVLLLPADDPGTDPAAGRATAPPVDDPESVEWLFARSLLTAGLTAPSGDGDVRVGVVERAVVVELAGQAEALLPLSGLVEFLTASYALVPTGSEEQAASAAVDAELARLLQEGC